MLCLSELTLIKNTVKAAPYLENTYIAADADQH